MSCNFNEIRMEMRIIDGNEDIINHNDNDYDDF